MTQEQVLVKGMGWYSAAWSCAHRSAIPAAVPGLSLLHAEHFVQPLMMMHDPLNLIPQSALPHLAICSCL